MRAKINSLPYCHILLTFCRIGSCCLILYCKYINLILILQFLLILLKNKNPEEHYIHSGQKTFKKRYLKVVVVCCSILIKRYLQHFISLSTKSVPNFFLSVCQCHFVSMSGHGFGFLKIKVSKTIISFSYNF